MGLKQDGVSRRLSKPRTNNNSSLSLLDFSDQAPPTSSTLTSSDMDYFGDAPIVTSQGERRSRRTSRSTLRAYLYGSRSESSQTLSSDDDERLSKRDSGDSRSSRKRVSLVGSSFMQLSSANRSTARFSNSSNARLLSSDDAEEPAIVAQQIKQRAHNDVMAAHNHNPSPIDEDKHVDSIFAPVRRKSLYTPGIATRNTSDILRKPPPQQGPQSVLSEADKHYYYDPTHSVSSPLARLAALNSHTDGRSTPCSLNVSHLGGLGLGTLRVTNDSVQPMTDPTSPCLRSPSQNSDAKNDYPKHAEAITEGSFPFPLQSQDKYPKHAEAITEGSFPFPLQPQDQPRPSRTSSTALSRRAADDDLDTEGQRRLAQRSAEDPEPASSPSAPAMAHEYMAEFGRSPFTLSSQLTRALDSHQSGNIDASLEAAYHGPSRSRSDSLHGESLHSSTRNSYASTFADPVDIALKADSGYNSYDSLDAHVTLEYEKHRFGETMPCAEAAETELPTPVDGKKARASIGGEPLKTSSRSISSQTIRKLQKMRPRSQTYTTPNLPVSECPDLHHFSGIDIPRVPSPMIARHTERLQHFPVLDHTFPSSHHISRQDSPEPACFMPSQVRFPSPANALESATTGFEAHCVSDGPNEKIGLEHDTVYAKDPAGEQYGEPKKSVALDAKRQKKAQKKLVKNAEETRRRLVREEKELAKRLEKDRKLLEEQVQKRDRAERSRSRLSRGRRSSSAYRQSHYEDGANIADLGTVAESLGSSPYDIATWIHPNGSREVRDCSPYQMTSCAQRPSSSTFHEGISNVPQERPRSSSRSQSRGRRAIPLDEISKHCRSSYDEQSRPRSTCNEEPPIPASYTPYRQAYAPEIGGSRPTEHKAVLDPTSHNLAHEGISQPKASPRPQSVFLPMSSAESSIHDYANRPFETEIVGRNIPNLWSKGSLEKKTPKSLKQENEQSADDIESRTVDPDDVWQAQRRAWAERRKSAGEALSNQHDLSGERRTEPRPDPASKDQPVPQSTLTISGLSGRYQGGLQYGYEPGCGLGGSAGTRAARNGASRKSIIVSQGFGLDLSDVPIFVAASPTA